MRLVVWARRAEARRKLKLAPRFTAVQALACICVFAFAAESSFDSERYLAHIKFLASPELGGRPTGSRELEKAAQYITEQFRAEVLQPHLQDFDVTTRARLGKANRFDFALAGETQSLRVAKGFIPINFSSSGKASGSVVFAGYGITAPEYNYDDYAGIDVKNKFVLVFADEPQEYDEKSVFEGKSYTCHAQQGRDHDQSRHDRAGSRGRRTFPI